MRQILLGPFGSMGIMNMKMRNICIEDVFVESFLLITAIIRMIYADTTYELVGALGSFIASSCISVTTSILVFDEGVQCACFRNKAVWTWCCCFWQKGVDVISDKSLLRVFNFVSLLGICGAIVTIITEIITFFDRKEVFNPVMSVPGVPVVDMYIERDHAIIVICLQCIITLPWRIYTYKVSKGVLSAIHCVEVLQFQASYKADVLRNLLPDTGLMHSVDLAHECDVSAIARIYCNSFSDLFEMIGLPRDASPKVIEAHWRSKGDVALARWLSRVGVVRDETGKVVAALSLQLPGDVAEYEQLAFCYKHNYAPVLLDSSSPLPALPVAPSDKALMNSPTPTKAYCCSPDEHVCTPGEAYIDFLCVDQAERREGSGRRLVKWAEQSAEKLGCGRIAASVWGQHKVTHEFYKNLGFHQTDAKTDFISYFLLQVIFCFKNRFFDWEKSLGQEKGLAIFSNKYGFTSDRISESDEVSSMNNSIHQGALRLLDVGKEVLTNTFVRSSSKREGPQSSKSATPTRASTSSPINTQASASRGQDTSSNAPKERRTKYFKSVEKTNVLDMITPNKLSSFSSKINFDVSDDSSHNGIDTSSKGLLGTSLSPTRRHKAPQHSYDSLNLLSNFSFGIKSTESNWYSTLDSSMDGSAASMVDEVLTDVTESTTTTNSVADRVGNRTSSGSAAVDRNSNNIIQNSLEFLTKISLLNNPLTPPASTSLQLQSSPPTTISADKNFSSIKSSAEV